MSIASYDEPLYPHRFQDCVLPRRSVEEHREDQPRSDTSECCDKYENSCGIYDTKNNK